MTEDDKRVIVKALAVAADEYRKHMIAFDQTGDARMALQFERQRKEANALWDRLTAEWGL